MTTMELHSAVLMNVNVDVEVDFDDDAAAVGAAGAVVDYDDEMDHENLKTDSYSNNCYNLRQI